MDEAEATSGDFRKQRASIWFFGKKCIVAWVLLQAVALR